jgi:hypothetical protein
MKIIFGLVIAGTVWPLSAAPEKTAAPSAAAETAVVTRAEAQTSGASVPKASPTAQPVQPPAAPAAPKLPASETLHYNVNWPSGLSLGEGQMTAKLQDGQWSFSFLMEASVPGFTLREGAKSSATQDYCSIELEKNATRGKRNVDETTTFDQKNSTASRQTNKGGKSELKTSACAKDALTYVFYLRRELVSGRLPQSQSVYYGAGYQVRAQYAGTQTMQVRGAAAETDRVTASIKGPSSSITVDLFFARDAVRTPVLIQAPLAMGKFSLELAR